MRTIPTVRFSRAHVSRLMAALATFATLAGCSGAGFSGWEREENMVRFEETQDFAESASGLDALDIMTRNGAIELVGADTDSVHIVATKKFKAPNDARAREFAEEFYTEITRRGDTLFVESIRPDDMPRDIESAGIAYRVTLPERFAARADSRNGAVKVVNLAGLVNVDTRNGAVNLIDVGSASEVITRNGAVNADLTRIVKDVSFSSRNGAIDVKIAEDVNGFVTLDTRNGSISLSTTELSGSRVETRNGSISVNVGDRLNGEMRVETSNGAIEVSVPRDAAFNLNAKSGRGRVHTDWGDGKQSFSATVNGGGFSMTLETSGGNVRVRRNE